MTTVPQRVYAHIGLPKTATTYLQFLMYANVEAFSRQGVGVVGEHGAHYTAASDLVGRPVPRTGKVPTEAWEPMARQILEEPAPAAVFSHERYSLCGQQEADRFLDSLHGVELHLVVTLRDFVAAEPSAWQEYVKNGGTMTWPEHAEAMAENPRRWRGRNRLRRVLKIWPERLPAERIHFVTVPGGGAPRHEIAHRFCTVLGVDTASLDTLEPPRQNSSLDPAATEMVRRLNLTEPQMSYDTQITEVKDWLAEGVLGSRRASKPCVEGNLLAMLEDETAWAIEALSGGFDVVGDPADLRAQRPQDPPAYDVDEALVLESALEALSRMATRSHQRGRQVRRLKRRVAKLESELGRRPPAVEPGSEARSSRWWQRN